MNRHPSFADTVLEGLIGAGPAVSLSARRVMPLPRRARHVARHATRRWVALTTRRPALVAGRPFKPLSATATVMLGLITLVLVPVACLSIVLMLQSVHL